MAREHVLVVDDEQDVVELIRYNLERAGYRVTCAGTGEETLALARSVSPDLVLLDLMLPGVDGLDVCRQLREDPATRDVPIVMVSARGEEADVVAGLELGADDYVTKPFSPRVLVSRVKAVLRRRARAVPEPTDTIRVGELEIDPGRHRVTLGGEPLELTASEFRILHLLASKPGWVFPRARIVEGVHGANHPATERSVDVQVMRLRKKLGPAGDLIETVRGVGYRFRDEGADER